MPTKKPIKRDGLVIVNPSASSIPVDTTMPYSSQPYTTANGQPVQPVTNGRLRQIAAGGSVKTYGKGL